MRPGKYSYCLLFIIPFTFACDCEPFCVLQINCVFVIPFSHPSCISPYYRFCSFCTCAQALTRECIARGTRARTRARTCTYTQVGTQNGFVSRHVIPGQSQDANLYKTTKLQRGQGDGWQ